MLKPELILPAGSADKMRFAFAYGADAVYAGAPLFSLRARENAFTKEALREGIAYAHAQGKRVYLTMNIFAHNSRLQGCLEAFQEMCDWKPDAFIVSDPGLLRQMHRLRPEMKLHLSTQANATNWMTIEFWRDQGVRRVVLPRELSLKEIAEIHERVPDVELECFVHGAMCMAYSGRCLISNYLNHRDANTGACTNACRWDYSLSVKNGSLQSGQPEVQESGSRLGADAGTYEVREKIRYQESKGADGIFEIDEDDFGTYLMNSKDLCAIELLQEIAAAGVSSFKVEGRSKTIYYVATVARAYRKAIDDFSANRPFDPELIREIAAISSRTYMTGFFHKRPGSFGENFEDGESRPLTHVFAASVVDYDAQRSIAWLDVRNKLSVGDSVEWMTPDGSHPQIITNLWNAKHELRQSCSGGQRCGIEVSFTPDEFTLLRKALPEGSAALGEQRLVVL